MAMSRARWSLQVPWKREPDAPIAPVVEPSAVGPAADEDAPAGVAWAPDPAPSATLLAAPAPEHVPFAPFAASEPDPVVPTAPFEAAPPTRDPASVQPPTTSGGERGGPRRGPDGRFTAGPRRATSPSRAARRPAAGARRARVVRAGARPGFSLRRRARDRPPRTCARRGAPDDPRAARADATLRPSDASELDEALTGPRAIRIVLVEDLPDVVVHVRAAPLAAPVQADPRHQRRSPSRAGDPRPSPGRRAR
jgi:hypothetical protein